MWFDWFFESKPIELPKHEDLWKSTPMDNNFSLDKLVVTATTDGAIKIDINGGMMLTIPAESRHLFLAKMQKAVDMADVADPDNDAT